MTFYDIEVFSNEEFITKALKAEIGYPGMHSLIHEKIRQSELISEIDLPSQTIEDDPNINIYRRIISSFWNKDSQSFIDNFASYNHIRRGIDLRHLSVSNRNLIKIVSAVNHGITDLKNIDLIEEEHINFGRIKRNHRGFLTYIMPMNKGYFCFVSNEINKPIFRSLYNSKDRDQEGYDLELASQRQPLTI